MGVLDHELGLAHPTQPVHRLHRHRRPGTPASTDGVEFSFPAGEMRIMTWHGEHLGQRTRKPRLNLYRPQRKRRRQVGLGPAPHRSGDLLA